MIKNEPVSVSPPKRWDPLLLLAALLGVSLLWCYWPTFTGMTRRWSTDPRYAHGYLVPVFALILFWIRRDRGAAIASRPSLGGVLLIGTALGIRMVGAYVFFGWLEGVSLLPAVAGFCVLVWGWPSLRWSWPAIAFLIFMLPLPYRLEGALASPLQRLAAVASSLALQTLGFPAVAEGNIIHLDEVELGVVEACNGLSMLFTFFALTTGLVIVIRRPWPDKVVIVMSAVPIALIVNTIRITVTGALHQLVDGRTANLVFHDLAGWLMMPLAMGLLWFELALMSRLLVEPARATTILKPIELAGAARDVQNQRGQPGGTRRNARQDAGDLIKGLLKNS